jgi:DNA polymerase-1
MGIIIVSNTSDESYFDLFKQITKHKNKAIFLDTEDQGLDPHTDRVLLVQLAIDDDVFMLDVARLGTDALTSIIKLINSCNCIVVAHNAKFDIKMLKSETSIMLNNVVDTMTIESLINAGIGSTYYSLGDLTEKYCNVTLDKSVRNEFIGMPFGTEFTENQIQYAAADTLYLPIIYEAQLKNVMECGLEKIYKIENDLIPAVAQMEYTGIKINPDVWISLEKQNIGIASKYHAEIIQNIVKSLDISKYENALQLADAMLVRVTTKRDRLALEGITDPSAVKEWIIENFNTNSNQQMKNALNKAGIKLDSTNEKILNKLPPSPIINSILSYREFQKLASTYGSNISDSVNIVTGRIHPDYLNIGTATGRFSCKNPNLQNIPRTGDYRKGFIAEDGFTFINMDYSQQEFRLAGALSRERAIVDAYLSGSDMHIATAANIYKKPLSEITREERSFGKTLNFAILYGTTEYGLKKNLNISLDEALNIIKMFYDGYPTLSSFKKMAEDRILELGYSITPLGRRRYFKPRPVFATPYEIERINAGTRREGFNHIIQGGGADVTKLAIIKMYNMNPFGDLFRLILQLHDEVGVEAHDSILDDAEEFMKECMISVFQPLLKEIPAEVESKRGKVWQK